MKPSLLLEIIRGGVSFLEIEPHWLLLHLESLNPRRPKAMLFMMTRHLRRMVTGESPTRLEALSV